MERVSKKLIRTASHFGHYCPGCNRTHYILVGGPGSVWKFDGNLEMPSFMPSVRIQWQSNKGARFCCHYNLIGGVIHYCPDCTHDLKGQKVPLPDYPADLPPTSTA